MLNAKERDRRSLLSTLYQLGWDYSIVRPLRNNREKLSVTAHADEKLVGLYCTLWTPVGTLMQVSTEDINFPISWWGELPPTPIEAKNLVDDMRRGRVHDIRRRILRVEGGQ